MPLLTQPKRLTDEFLNAIVDDVIGQSSETLEIQFITTSSHIGLRDISNREELAEPPRSMGAGASSLPKDAANIDKETAQAAAGS